MASRSKITRLSSQFTLTTITTPPLVRSLHPQPFSLPSHHHRHAIRLSSSLPRVADTTVWTSLIPKFLRNRDPKSSSSKKPKSKEWNPATFFIIIFLLIGSHAIRMLGLRNEFANFNRSADARIELLKGVIERLEKGEKVDVEKLIGREDEAREWEEVLKEIEMEDLQWRKAQREKLEATKAAEEEAAKATEPPTPSKKSDENPPEDQKPRPFAFY
ncbi:hypothetical protein FQN54_008339 [Arachnomyces sp. PD_36]|nr:hypothetical protein FQN54_008339 [Arachnomyces sp. PD_36]